MSYLKFVFKAPLHTRAKTPLFIFFKMASNPLRDSRQTWSFLVSMHLNDWFGSLKDKTGMTSEDIPKFVFEALVNIIRLNGNLLPSEKVVKLVVDALVDIWNQECKITTDFNNFLRPINEALELDETRPQAIRSLDWLIRNKMPISAWGEACEHVFEQDMSKVASVHSPTPHYAYSDTPSQEESHYRAKSARARRCQSSSSQKKVSPRCSNLSALEKRVLDLEAQLAEKQEREKEFALLARLRDAEAKLSTSSKDVPVRDGRGTSDRKSRVRTKASSGKQATTTGNCDKPVRTPSRKDTKASSGKQVTSQEFPLLPLDVCELLIEATSQCGTAKAREILADIQTLWNPQNKPSSSHEEKVGKCNVAERKLDLSRLQEIPERIIFIIVALSGHLTTGKLLHEVLYPLKNAIVEHNSRKSAGRRDTTPTTGPASQKPGPGKTSKKSYVTPSSAGRPCGRRSAPREASSEERTPPRIRTTRTPNPPSQKGAYQKVKAPRSHRPVDEPSDDKPPSQKRAHRDAKAPRSHRPVDEPSDDKLSWNDMMDQSEDWGSASTEGW